MADSAGGVAAARARFVDQWKVDGHARTPAAFQNEVPIDQDGNPRPWPPQDGAGKPVPWVYFEMIFTDSTVRGAGRPGHHVWLTTGNIYGHVFVPQGYGVDAAHQLAVAFGEIFRAATFFNQEPGVKLICMAPRNDGGESDADNGNQFRITCTVPFEFYHRG